MKVIKSISIMKGLWNNAMDKAQKEGVSLSSVISAYLKRWVKK
jgi:hypothetical protein